MIILLNFNILKQLVFIINNEQKNIINVFILINIVIIIQFQDSDQIILNIVEKRIVITSRELTLHILMPSHY